MIVCWSIKGGSGTTVVAAALALTCAKRTGCQTRLIDLSGDIPATLGISEPVNEGVSEWLSADDNPGAEALGNLMLPASQHLGVIHRGRNQILSPLVDPVRLSDLAVAIAASPMISVVDAGSGAAVIPIFEHATRSLLIIRPCYLALRKASLLKKKPDGIITINEPGRALGAREIESVIGAPVVAQIPFDPAVARVVDSGLLASRLPNQLATHLGAIC